MDGVSINDFTSWSVTAARRKLKTLSNADTTVSNAIIAASHSFDRIHIESSAVSAVYVITIQDSKSSYDELTSQLEEGLSNGMFISYYTSLVK